VSRSRDAQRWPRPLEAEVFDLMTRWTERYRRQAGERFRRLDAVLAAPDLNGRSGRVQEESACGTVSALPGE
jgi:hypothetical protein